MKRKGKQTWDEEMVALWLAAHPDHDNQKKPEVKTEVKNDGKTETTPTDLFLIPKNDRRLQVPTFRGKPLHVNT